MIIHQVGPRRQYFIATYSGFTLQYLSRTEDLTTGRLNRNTQYGVKPANRLFNREIGSERGRRGWKVEWSSFAIIII